MKTNVLTRLSAFAMSALFATVATLGVAGLMTISGEHNRLGQLAQASVQQAAQPAAAGKLAS